MHRFQHLIYQPTKKFLLLLTDLSAYIFSMLLALWIRNFLPDFLYHIDFPGFSIRAYFLPHTFVFFLIIVIVFVNQGLYQHTRNFWNELIELWKSLLLSALVTYLFLFNTGDFLPFVSRTVMIILYLSLFIIVPLMRVILKSILFRLKYLQNNMVMICQIKDRDQAIKLCERFAKDFYFGMNPIALCIESYQESNITIGQKEIPICTSFNHFPQDTKIFILGTSLENAGLIQKVYAKFDNLFLIPEKHWAGLMDFGAHFFFTERIFVIPLRNKLNSKISYFLKFLMDRILGFLFVLILSPIFLILSVLICKSSPGPVFYSHLRVGKGGKLFKVWKFRSMYQDADKKLAEVLATDPALKREWNQFFKLKNDPRITKIGAFIRKYSLDELPQLFNVILGEMSLVGPRPFVPGEVEEINPDLIPLYVRVKPGLTGLWQVSGRNENDRKERVQIDMWYIQNWSVSLDLLILLNTPKVVFTGRGAS